MNKRDIFYIVATALLFSTMEVVLKIAGTQLDAFQLTFLRFAIGGLFLLPFAVRDVRKRNVQLHMTDWIYLALLGVICICISMLFFQIGIDNANANLVSVIICANPLFVMIFAHFLVNEKFTRRKAFILAISLIGLFFAANPFNLAEGNTLFGLICAIIASVTFGLYTTVGKLKIARIGDITQTCFSFIIGSVLMLVPMIVLGKPIIGGIHVSHLPVIIYLGVAVTGIGYYMYFQAIHSCGPSKASIVFFLKPMFAPIIALVVLGEALRWNMIIGIILLLTGSLINMRTPAKNNDDMVPSKK